MPSMRRRPERERHRRRHRRRPPVHELPAAQLPGARQPQRARRATRIEALDEALAEGVARHGGHCRPGREAGCEPRQGAPGGSRPRPRRQGRATAEQGVGLLLLRAASATTTRRSSAKLGLDVSAVRVRPSRTSSTASRPPACWAGASARRWDAKLAAPEKYRHRHRRRRLVHVRRAGGGALGLAQDEPAGALRRLEQLALERGAERHAKRLPGRLAGARPQRSPSATSRQPSTSRWSARRPVATASASKTRRRCPPPSSAPCTPCKVEKRQALLNIVGA